VSNENFHDILLFPDDSSVQKYQVNYAFAIETHWKIGGRRNESIFLITFLMWYLYDQLKEDSAEEMFMVFLLLKSSIMHFLVLFGGNSDFHLKSSVIRR
jgi:hypothetical protein